MTTFKFLVAIILMNTAQVFADEPLSKFFANPSLQKKHPFAFALQAESAPFLYELTNGSQAERIQLAQALAQNSEILQSFAKLHLLTLTEYEALLRKIFLIQTELAGVTASTLVIDDNAKTGAAFFEFDLNHPSSGKVILSLAQMQIRQNKWEPILLLIHETRHSFQFQKAFLGKQSPPIASSLQKGYQAAFTAQKELGAQLSFCDFLTLENEFEAFQFANEVVGRLSQWTADTLEMGTFASQYDSSGKLKIDLLKLFELYPQQDLHLLFNELEKEQLRLLQTR